MSCHSDDVPSTVLFADKKAPSGGSIFSFLAEQEHLPGKQTIARSGGRFGVLDGHDLLEIFGRDFFGLDPSRFAPEEIPYLPEVRFTNRRSLEALFDQEAINEFLCILRANCFPYFFFEPRNLSIRTCFRGRWSRCGIGLTIQLPRAEVGVFAATAATNVFGDLRQ